MDKRFLCWRYDSDGMFEEAAAGTGVTEPRPMCPAMQRMPQLGSVASEIVVAAMLALRLVANLCCVLPAAAAAGNVAGVFAGRATDARTFHSVLDSQGMLLLDFEPIVYALQRSNMHTWNTLGKISELLRGRRGHGAIEGVLLGMQKVMEHMEGASVFDAAALSMLGRATSFMRPVKRAAAGFSAAATSSPVGNFPAYIGMMRRLFIMAASTSRLGALVLSRVLMRLIGRSGDQPVGLGLVSSILLDTAEQVRSLWLDNMRTQCEGLSQVIGHTNPLARLVRHACLLGPDSIDGLLAATLVVAVEYPIMHCVCKLPTGQSERDANNIIRTACLADMLPVDYAAWARAQLVAGADAQQDACFASMDVANRKLLTAFDPYQARLFKATHVVESCLDYMTAPFKDDAGDCEDLHGSAYVMTIMPDPVDYFMLCARTFDCRARCLDTHAGFEQARATAVLAGLAPSFEHTAMVTVQSKFFSTADLEQGRHRPPFAVWRIHELAPAVCREKVCRNSLGAHQSKCLVAAGRDSANNLAVAYYCVPTHVAQFVSAYSKLPFSDGDPQYARPTGARMIGLYMLTDRQVLTGEREQLLTLSVDSDTWSLHALGPAPANTRFLLFETTAWAAGAYEPGLLPEDRPLHKID